MRERDQVLESLQQAKPGDIVHLIGPPAAGRRSLLRDIETTLSQSSGNLCSLDLAISDLDSTLHALVGFLPLSEFERSSMLSSRALLGKVEQQLREKPPKVALVYAPWLHWLGWERTTPYRVGKSIQTVLEVLQQFCPIVLAGGNWPSTRRIRINKVPGTQDWLAGELPEQASVLAPLIDSGLNSRLELRLLFGLLEAGQPFSEIESLSRDRRPLEAIAKAFWTSLVTNRDWDSLQLWKFLAVARCPIPGQWLEQEFSCPANSWLRRALTYQEGPNVILHQSLRNFALRSLQSELEVWKELHSLHAQRWKQQRDSALEMQDVSGIKADLHFIYHWIESGKDPAAIEGQIRFQEQLCLIGRSLSKTHSRYEEAYRCFERARQIDPQDAYAWHYASYNLAKTMGFRTQEVDEGYLKAVELDPEQLWYHQRWVRWLLERGRRKEAREAWRQTQPTFDEDPPVDYYRNLHKLVATRALETGDLLFCCDVLQEIPPRVFDTDEELRKCRTRCQVLQLAEDDLLVRPLQFALDRGGENLYQHPELLPRKTKAGDLQRWYAARIERLEGDALVLRLAIPARTAQGTIEVSYRRSIMKGDIYDTLTQDESLSELTPGRFLEIGEYGTHNAGLIRVFRCD